MRVLILASLLFVGCSSVMLKSDDAKISGTTGKPDGDGPFAAIVLLHGCGGPQPGNALWAAELNKWRYVTMEVDSFLYRSVKEIVLRSTTFERSRSSTRTVSASWAGPMARWSFSQHSRNSGESTNRGSRPVSLCIHGVKVELHIRQPWPDATYLGHQVGYSHQATMRARKDVKDFLGRTL